MALWYDLVFKRAAVKTFAFRMQIIIKKIALRKILWIKKDDKKKVLYFKDRQPSIMLRTFFCKWKRGSQKNRLLKVVE